MLFLLPERKPPLKPDERSNPRRLAGVESNTSMAVAETIQFQGAEDTLIWRYPLDSCNTSTELQVDDAHEVLLVMKNKPADLFSSGKYTFTHQTLAVAKSQGALPKDAKKSFSCRIYYANILHRKEVLWGFPEPLALKDPLFDIFLHTTACGRATISIADTALFLHKCLHFPDKPTDELLLQELRALFCRLTKECLVKVIQKGKLSYFTLATNTCELGTVLTEQITPALAEYGLCLHRYQIEDISIPYSELQLLFKERQRYAARVSNASWLEERRIILSDKYDGNELNALLEPQNFADLVYGVFCTKSAETEEATQATEETASQPEAVREAEPAKDQPETAPVPEPVDEPAPPEISDPSPADPFFHPSASASVSEPSYEAAAQTNYCPTCGASVQADALFCFKCGFKLVHNCPSCGTQLSPEALFCHRCGTKV